MWDPPRHTVYDVVEPSFNEVAVPRWWRKPDQVAEEDEEPLVVPDIIDADLVPTKEVHFPNAANDIDPTPPGPPLQAPPAPAPALAPPLPGVPSPTPSPPAWPRASPFPPPSPLPDESHLRGSSNTNRGVPPLRLTEMLMGATEETGEDDLKIYKQAMNSELWREECKVDVDSLIDNKVFSVVDKPANKPVITSKWIYEKKKGESGKVKKPLRCIT